MFSATNFNVCKPIYVLQYLLILPKFHGWDLGTHNLVIELVNYPLRKDPHHIIQALKIGEAKNDKHYKEALILLAKTNYIQGHFQECLDTLQTVH